jgi:hypothetical protein
MYIIQKNSVFLLLNIIFSNNFVWNSRMGSGSAHTKSQVPEKSTGSVCDRKSSGRPTSLSGVGVENFRDIL